MINSCPIHDNSCSLKNVTFVSLFVGLAVSFHRQRYVFFVILYLYLTQKIGKCYRFQGLDDGMCACKLLEGTAAFAPVGHEGGDAAVEGCVVGGYVLVGHLVEDDVLDVGWGDVDELQVEDDGACGRMECAPHAAARHDAVGDGAALELGSVVAHIHVEGYGEALLEELVEQAPALRGGGCGWQGEYDFVARYVNLLFLAGTCLQPKLIG